MDALYAVLVLIVSFIVPPSSPSTSPITTSTTSSSSITVSSSSTGDSEVPGGMIGETFRPYLVKLDGHSLCSIDPNSLDGVKYYALYFSASWCPPSRAFTPKLVDFYNSFKPSHPNFELIFISEDQSASAMADYMRMDRMPWTAVDYRSRQSSRLAIGRWAGEYIPDLLLIDSKGNVLSSSYDSGTYVGPERVINDIQSIVPTP